MTRQRRFRRPRALRGGRPRGPWVPGAQGRPRRPVRGPAGRPRGLVRVVFGERVSAQAGAPPRGTALGRPGSSGWERKAAGGQAGGRPRGRGEEVTESQPVSSAPSRGVEAGGHHAGGPRQPRPAGGESPRLGHPSREPRTRLGPPPPLPCWRWEHPGPGLESEWRLDGRLAASPVRTSWDGLRVRPRSPGSPFPRASWLGRSPSLPAVPASGGGREGGRGRGSNAAQSD